MTFFGSSFIADQYGNMVASMDRRSEGFITFEFDLQNINDQRISWGVFRDRRPDLYQRITKLLSKNGKKTIVSYIVWAHR